jgi:hypothetical protein
MAMPIERENKAFLKPSGEIFSKISSVALSVDSCVLTAVWQ